MILPANVKYQMIHEMPQREDNWLNVTWLCDAACVSRSGYYHYTATYPLNETGCMEPPKTPSLCVAAVALPFAALVQPVPGILSEKGGLALSRSENEIPYLLPVRLQHI